MEKSDLVLHVVKESPVFEDWHWFAYHFQFYLHGREHPFARSIIEACLKCEHGIPGFAKSFLDDLFSISGKRKHYPHYEQLMQSLAELLVIQQMVEFDWGSEADYSWEPTAGDSEKNPELTIDLPEYTVGVEVKCPSMIKHANARGTNPMQVPGRTPMFEGLASTNPDPDSDVTLPRDNPVKDFLISADEKFEAFKAEYECFEGVLAIVWDDHIYEPISSLLNKASGLFTERSFAKDDDENVLQFSNVDAVFLIRHLHQLARAASDRPLGDSLKHALDYGRDGEFPPKAYIPNPHGKGSSELVQEAFQAYPPSPDMGAEYMPTDAVWWFDV